MVVFHLAEEKKFLQTSIGSTCGLCDRTCQSQFQPKVPVPHLYHLKTRLRSWVSLGTAQVFTEPLHRPGSVRGARDTAWMRSRHLLTPRKADRSISKELHHTDRMSSGRVPGAGSDFFLRGGDGVRFQSWSDVSWSGGGRDGRDRHPRQVTLAREAGKEVTSS